MDIIIKESGVAKPLVYMDTATGTECTLDILQKALYALCEEFGQAAVSQEFMKYQHLLNTDEENEHKVIQKIFDTIRETLSAK